MLKHEEQWLAAIADIVDDFAQIGREQMGKQSL